MISPSAKTKQCLACGKTLPLSAFALIGTAQWSNVCNACLSSEDSGGSGFQLTNVNQKELMKREEVLKEEQKELFHDYMENQYALQEAAAKTHASPEMKTPDSQAVTPSQSESTPAATQKTSGTGFLRTWLNKKQSQAAPAKNAVPTAQAPASREKSSLFQQAQKPEEQHQQVEKEIEDLIRRQYGPKRH